MATLPHAGLCPLAGWRTLDRTRRRRRATLLRSCVGSVTRERRSRATGDNGRRATTSRGMTMRVNRGLLGWGVFFLVLGAVPLVVAYGGVAASTFDRAWQLWPLLLIGAGLGLVFARTRAAVV